jgi:uncharacterized protein YndB with AHSA1/START domain
MSTTAAPSATQTYRVYIKAEPQAVFAALTDRDTTGRYGYGAPVEVEPRVGGAFRTLATDLMKEHGGPDVIADGEVVAFDAPRRFAHTWRILWDEDLAAEGFTRVAYDIEGREDGVTKLTLTHDVDGAPGVASQVSGEAGPGGGWSEILSDLKTLLETGRPITG